MSSDSLYLGELSSHELVELKDVFFPQSYIDQAAREVDDILRLFGLPPDQLSLLDLPCGVGRHSFPMAQRGVAVTGVELCQVFLLELRQRADEEGLRYETVLQDMREFRREGFYDVAICLWDSLGICSGLDDDKRIIGNLHASLKAGGQLLIEVHPLELWVYSILNEGGGGAHLEFSKTHYRDAIKKKNISIIEEKISFKDQFRRVEVEALERDNNDLTEIHTQFQVRPRSLSNWIDILESQGFGDISIYADFAGRAYATSDLLLGRSAKFHAIKRAD